MRVAAVHKIKKQATKKCVFDFAICLKQCAYF